MGRYEFSYYGELEYQLTYKHYNSIPFSWLFVDFDRLRNIAIKCGWTVELIYEDDHFHYLARLTLLFFTEKSISLYLFELKKSIMNNVRKLHFFLHYFQLYLVWMKIFQK